MKKLKYYGIGQVVWANLSPVVGEELGGIRPCKICGRKGYLVQVVPYIYKNDKYYPVYFQARTIDDKRIIGLYEGKEEDFDEAK